MKHTDALAILLEPATGAPAGGATAPADRTAAEEHVARCSDCWTVVASAYQDAFGEAPADAGRMAALFGCDAIRDRLYLLVDLRPAELRAQEPDAARHLGWCPGCRERLAELRAVEQAAVAGEFPPLFTPAPKWRETISRVGATVLEAIGETTIRIGRAAAAFVEVPDGFLVGAVPVPVGVYRGEHLVEHAGGSPSLGQEVQFALADSGLWVELRLEPQSDELVAIALRVAGAEDTDVSVQLRAVEAGRAELVSRHTVRGSAPVRVVGVRPGRYVLEIHERERTLRFKLRFDVELDA